VALGAEPGAGRGRLRERSSWRFRQLLALVQSGSGRWGDGRGAVVWSVGHTVCWEGAGEARGVRGDATGAWGDDPLQVMETNALGIGSPQSKNRSRLFESVADGIPGKEAVTCLVPAGPSQRGAPAARLRALALRLGCLAGPKNAAPRCRSPELRRQRPTLRVGYGDGPSPQSPGVRWRERQLAGCRDLCAAPAPWPVTTAEGTTLLASRSC